MNDITKNIILTYARAVRSIQNNQIEVYINNIAKELTQQWPSLDETNAIDWAYDIINADSNQEVVYTLNRLEGILKEQERKKWVCSYCGKNTYDMDIDYVNGTDHLACIFENEVKNKQDCVKEQDEQDCILNERKANIQHLEELLKYVQEELNKLKV